MADPQDRRAILRGILLLIVSASLFGAVDGLSKILADTQSVAQIVWARYVLAIPVILASVRLTEWTSLFRTNLPGRQILRGLTPLSISVGMVLGVRYLPLADATVLLFAGPFIVVILSAPLLGEHVPLSSWIGMETMICLSGTLSTLRRPGSRFRWWAASSKRAIIEKRGFSPPRKVSFSGRMPAFATG